MLCRGFILLFMCLLFYFLSLSIIHDIFINYLTIPLFINTFFENIYFYSYVHNFIIWFFIYCHCKAVLNLAVIAI